MNSPPGKTSFGGTIKPAINFVDRTGHQLNGVTLTTAGYSGNWWGRCDQCGAERLFKKDAIRKGKVACCAKKD